MTMVTKTMRRREYRNQARFLTCSCNQRLALFGRAAIRDCFARHLEKSLCKHEVLLDSWVLMPDHFHLLVMPKPPRATVVRFLWELKRGVALEVVGRWRELAAPILNRLTGPTGRVHFWLPGGGYDRTVRSDSDLAEKRRYIHNNPVKRGLVPVSTDWRWSSAGWYRDRTPGLVPVQQLAPA